MVSPLKRHAGAGSSRPTDDETPGHAAGRVLHVRDAVASSLTCGLDVIRTEPPTVVCDLKDEGGPGGPYDHEDARRLGVAAALVKAHDEMGDGRRAVWVAMRWLAPSLGSPVLAQV